MYPFFFFFGYRILIIVTSHRFPILTSRQKPTHRGPWQNHSRSAANRREFESLCDQSSVLSGVCSAVWTGSQMQSGWVQLWPFDLHDAWGWILHGFYGEFEVSDVCEKWVSLRMYYYDFYQFVKILTDTLNMINCWKVKNSLYYKPCVFNSSQFYFIVKS